MVRKVTFRLDDDVAERLETFCSIHGATMTAVVSAFIRQSLNRYEECGGRTIASWPAGRSRDTFMAVLAEASEIDAMRRQRRRPNPPDDG